FTRTVRLLIQIQSWSGRRDPSINCFHPEGGVDTDPFVTSGYSELWSPLGKICR
ncbi:hypothetical protein NPIL_545571, partial [Nephila pilipes]